MWPLADVEKGNLTSLEALLDGRTRGAALTALLDARLEAANEFTLLAFAAVLSRRREDATALLVVEEMAQTPFAHPSFVRFLGGRGKLCNPLRVDIIEGRRWLFIWTVDASTLRAGEAL